MMTVDQYKAIMKDKDFKKDVIYILCSENCKIQASRFAKVELDEANGLLIAYMEHKNSTPENPIYYQDWVTPMQNVCGVQFKRPDYLTEDMAKLADVYSIDY